MQSRSVKLPYNQLIYNTTFASTLHKDILCIKNLFNLPEFFVLKRNIACRQTGIGDQYPFSIKSLFFFDLFLVNGNRVFFNGQVFFKPLVSNQ